MPTMNSTERLDRARSCGVVGALIGPLLSAFTGLLSEFFFFNLLYRLFNGGHERGRIGQITFGQLKL